MKRNDLYLLTDGNNGCDVPRKKIADIADAIKRHYYFSNSEFWMWKMFQFGYAYGKRAERRKKKNASNSAATLKEAM